MARQRKRFSGRWKRGSAKAVTSWLRREGSPIALQGSVTEFGASPIVVGTELQTQSSSTPTVVFERSNSMDPVLKRLLIKLSIHFVVSAAGVLLKWYFGVYRTTQAGTLLNVVDPRINVGTAGQQAANASVDWLWQDTRSVAPAAGAYSLEELLGAPINFDVRSARRMSTNDTLMFACAIQGSAGTPPPASTQATVDFFSQSLWQGVGS